MAEVVRQPGSEAAFLVGGGTMGALIRAHDWSTTSLGPVEGWPEGLRVMVGTMLVVPQAMWIGWGPELIQIYNDGYRVLLDAERHGTALGRPAAETWADNWAVAGSMLAGVLDGGPAVFQADRREVYRHDGEIRERFFSFSFSPVPLPAAPNGVGGVLCVAVETTQSILLRESEARLRFMSSLDEALQASYAAPDAMQAATELLARHLGASRCAYADVDADSDRFTIRSDYSIPGLESSAGTYSLDLFGSRAAADMRSGRTLVVCDVPGELAPGDGREMFLSIGISAIVCCPLVKDGRLVAMMALHQVARRNWQHDEIDLVEAVVERCWAYVERVAAEARLREINDTLEQRVAKRTAERNLLARIVETTDAFIQVLDLDYRFLAVNKASASEFERIYGVRPKVGDTYPELLADRPQELAKVQAFWGRALAGEEFTFTEPFGDPALDRPYYEIKFNTLRNEQGERIGAYQFVYDVTERLRDQDRLQQTEDALRQSQKMEAVGQLTGGLAHDFNNLLAGISGSLELMGTRVAQGRVGDVERYLAAAQGTARRAAALTHRLLAFSRRQTLAPKVTDVNALVTGMEELIRRSVGPGSSVESVTGASVWPVEVDANQLENALLNLCINARDAMPDGGRITIETANRWMDARAAREQELSPGQYVSLCVSDTGTGMTPEIIARAFDPFFTTKPIGMGTGLGLSMVYGFARQSGGQVRIYSEVGQGTTICLYLPRYLGGESDEEAPTDGAAAAPIKAGETVLVIDDEPVVRMLVVDVLEELGYSALEASDGPEGLKVLQSKTRIDLLITDVGLPGGLNGRQVADAARVLRPELRVLFITGYAENAVLNHGHLEPGMQVVTKPFQVEELGRQIQAILLAD